MRGDMRIHDRGVPHHEHAFTGLELVIIIVVIAGAMTFLLISLTGGEVPVFFRTFPGGLVAESAYMSGDHLQPVGSVFGFPAVSGIHGSAELMFAHPDPGRLGAVRMMISLFMGDTGAIDMDRVNVSWAGSGSYEQLQKTNTLPLICPNWTISGKYNMLPGRSADSDNWLEPDEEFEIIACPSTGFQPYRSFTLTISPEGSAMPLTVTRMVPSRVLPVMNLG